MAARVLLSRAQTGDLATSVERATATFRSEFSALRATLPRIIWILLARWRVAEPSSNFPASTANVEFFVACSAARLILSGTHLRCSRRNVVSNWNPADVPNTIAAERRVAHSDETILFSIMKMWNLSTVGG